MLCFSGWELNSSLACVISILMSMFVGLFMSILYRLVCKEPEWDSFTVWITVSGWCFTICGILFYFLIP